MCSVLNGVCVCTLCVYELQFDSVNPQRKSHFMVSDKMESPRCLKGISKNNIQKCKVSIVLKYSQFLFSTLNLYYSI